MDASSLSRNLRVYIPLLLFANVLFTGGSLAATLVMLIVIVTDSKAVKRVEVTEVTKTVTIQPDGGRVRVFGSVGVSGTVDVSGAVDADVTDWSASSTIPVEVENRKPILVEADTYAPVDVRIVRASE